MFLLVGGVVMLLMSNVLGKDDLPPKLPDNYKDVFVAGNSGKPTLGSTISTCWARGGICVDIRECPSLNMDVSVPGCSWGYKVCCKVHQPLSPTVGVFRRYDIPVIRDLQDLGASLEILALRNSMLLNDWKTSKSNSDELTVHSPAFTLA